MTVSLGYMVAAALVALSTEATFNFTVTLVVMVLGGIGLILDEEKEIGDTPESMLGIAAYQCAVVFCFMMLVGTVLEELKHEAAMNIIHFAFIFGLISAITFSFLWLILLVISRIIDRIS